MNKRINNNDFMYPAPVFIIGARVKGKANFMTASWVMRVNMNPNIMAVSFNTNRHTYHGIEEHQELSINLMSNSEIIATDYCALVSGKRQDKSTVFKTFYGELKNAPLLEDAPLCAECKTNKIIRLEDHDVVIAEVINTYAKEECLNNDKPDLTKLDSFVFTMPGNEYWALGEKLGKAWNMRVFI